jgi:hypothetical protein
VGSIAKLQGHAKDVRVHSTAVIENGDMGDMPPNSARDQVLFLGAQHLDT